MFENDFFRGRKCFFKPASDRVLVLLALVFAVYIYMNSNLNSIMIVNELGESPASPLLKTIKTIGKFPTNTKLILFYTTFFGDKPWFAKTFEKSDCDSDIKKCRITYNNNLFAKSDVVIFHARNMPSYVELSRLNRQRKKGQLWLYFVMESLLNTPSINEISKFFNLTSTYRVDSDIPIIYKYRFPVHSVAFERDYYSTKSDEVAWIVSHCERNRETLARKLIGYGVQIKVAGGCSMKFPQNRFTCSNRECDDVSRFKFYFAAENSLCKDYITEKYWKRLTQDLIPIVFGGSNYSDERLAIPGSFIDAMSFPSPKSLAEYILKVSKNRILYNSYFAWKSNWGFRDKGYYTCKICEYFSNSTSKKVLSVKPFRKEECSEPLQRYQEWIRREVKPLSHNS